MPDVNVFCGKNIPYGADKIMEEAVAEFNKGCEDCLSLSVYAAHPGVDSTSCPSWMCDACIHGCSYEANRKAFAIYAKKCGYKITREGYTDMLEKNRLSFKVPERSRERYIDLLQAIIHGWESVLSMRHLEWSSGALIDTEYDKVNVTIDVESLQNEGVSVDDCFGQIQELVELITIAMSGHFSIEGTVEWDHNTHTHKLYGEGYEVKTEVEYPVKEMTVDEISNALGYTVKVVGEEKK